MSFFDTEEAHAVMLAYAADGGGRAALKVTPTFLNVQSLGGGRRPPGSSGKSRLNAPAQFGAKKDIHIPYYRRVKKIKWASLFFGVKAIIELRDSRFAFSAKFIGW